MGTTGLFFELPDNYVNLPGTEDAGREQQTVLLISFTYSGIEALFLFRCLPRVVK